jgi:hypothetical protein
MPCYATSRDRGATNYQLCSFLGTFLNTTLDSARLQPHDFFGNFIFDQRHVSHISRMLLYVQHLFSRYLPFAMLELSHS